MYSLRLRSVLHTLLITAWLILTLGSPTMRVQAEPARASYTAFSASRSATGVDPFAPVRDSSSVTNGVQEAARGAAGNSRDIDDLRAAALNDVLDPGFGASNGYVPLDGSSPRTLMQADGGILILVDADATAETHLIRLLEDGTVDSGFGTNGQITFPKDSVTSFALGADGRIVVAGVCSAQNYEVRLQRFLSNGQPDTTFNNGNPLCQPVPVGYYDFKVSRAFVQPDGKIVILAHSWWCGGGISYPTIQAAAGNANMYCDAPSFLIRFDSQGSIDSTFSSNGVFNIYVPDPPTASTVIDIYDVLVQKDGSFLLITTVRDYHASEPYLAIIRVTSQGEYDLSFDGDGAFVYYELGVDRYGCALAVQQSGRIIAIGSDGSSFLLGITADGAIDTSFGTAGKVVLPESSCSLLSLPTNAIVTAGFADPNLVVRMFNPDGSANPFFANGGIATFDALGSPNGLNLQPNGKIILTGSANGQTFVARLKLLFEDVSYLHWAQPWIERLYASGITSGCAANPLRYCPSNSITRAQMAIFLLKAEHGASYTPPPATGIFTDVPAGSPAAPWIEQLANEGITGGCGGGKYCPTNLITRAQMAIFLLRAEHGSIYTPPAATGMFLDVPETDFAAPFIEQLANESITGGCGGNKYCPANPVTRDQLAVFLVRTFKLP